MFFNCVNSNAGSPEQYAPQVMPLATMCSVKFQLQSGEGEKRGRRREGDYFFRESLDPSLLAMRILTLGLQI